MIDPTVPANAASAPGAELTSGAMIGRYRLVARLGAGAMGVVWSATDPQLERDVAIKVVHPMLARSPDASERLLREARAMAKLSHRAVVTVHDAGEVEGRLFLAMELVPGTTLGQMLRARSPAQVSDWQRWLAMMIEAGQGLAAAHDKGVLHRDFKPDNVLVDAGGRVCVGDFGLATLGHINAAGASQPMDVRDLDLTTTGALVGTPMYMSAEQLRGAPIDARADQFAFCVALYEALYDRKPFSVSAQGIDAIVELREEIERGEILPAPPGSTVPAEVHRIVVRGLAARPEDRWPTLNALLAQLARAAGLSTLREPPPASPARRARWPFLLAGIAIAGLVLALVLTRHRDAAAPARLEPELLFGVATHTVIAISPDGAHIAVGNDALEVRELGGAKRIVSTPVASHEVSYVEMDAKEVRFSQRGESVFGHWQYAGDGSVQRGQDFDGVWFGTTVAGSIVAHDRDLRIVSDGRILRQRTASARIDVAIASPDRRRVAYIDPARFSGKIIVWDIDRDVAIESPRIDSPTALDWLDDDTLVYASGVYAAPTLWRLPIRSTGFGAPVQLYAQRFGWFGYLRAHRDASGTTLYAVDMRPSARTRAIERTAAGRTVHDFDTTTTTVALGWLDDHEFLAWARDTGIVERRTDRAHVAKTNIVLPSEPANATRAGDTLIASLRTVKGREVVAYSLASPDGVPLWRDPDLLAVRCAGDRQVPCFAVIALADSEQVVAIDPTTGKLGTEILFTGTIEDIAVTTDGNTIHVADRAAGIVHLDPRGVVIGTTHAGTQPWVRSIACTTDGTLLVGGTAFRNIYQVGAITGDRYEMLTETENDILSLVRPSDDGASVLFLARTFAPEVFRLRL